MKNQKSDSKKTTKAATKAEAKKSAAAKKKGKFRSLLLRMPNFPSHLRGNKSPFSISSSNKFSIDPTTAKKEAVELKDKPVKVEEVKASKSREKDRKTPKSKEGPKRH